MQQVNQFKKQSSNKDKLLLARTTTSLEDFKELITFSPAIRKECWKNPLFKENYMLFKKELCNYSDTLRKVINQIADDELFMIIREKLFKRDDIIFEWIKIVLRRKNLPVDILEFIIHHGNEQIWSWCFSQKNITADMLILIGNMTQYVGTIKKICCHPNASENVFIQQMYFHNNKKEVYEAILQHPNTTEKLRNVIKKQILEPE